MTLFNYSKCKMCKRLGDKRKVALSNIFPSNVCDLIVGFNHQCYTCKCLFEKETEFKNKYGYDKVPEIEGLEKAELQLNFLHKYNKNPINLMYDEKDWVKKIKKDIDNMFDADFVKKNYEKVNSNYKQSNHFVKRIFIS